MGEKLANNLERLFEGAGDIKPSILHGDLWTGNYSTANGQPAVYDPASYYDHSEAEFGMSWCAGFTDAFYEGYHELVPRAPGCAAARQALPAA